MAAATGLHRQARLCAARPATFAPLSPCSSLPHALRSPCGLSARLVPGGPCPRPVHTLVPQQQQQQQHTPQQQSQLHQRHVCQAAAAALESAEPEGKGMGRLLSLGVLFVGWYATNIYFNIYQKQILKVFNFPLTCTNLQFLIGAGLAVIFWTTGIVKKPKLDAATLSRIYPLAIIHVVGNVLTNVSLGAVAVSFTHTVKAMEPFFSVLMSAIFLGDIPPIPVLLTLIPIVGGVIMASLSEVTFNWTGFTSALLSNITFQSRTVLSKKLMITKGALDNMNMFQILTIMSFFMLLPVTLLFEGFQLCPAAWSSMGMNEAAQQVLMQRLLLAGVCFHGYQQLSYMILGQVTPVTHSIGNCVKRVVVIVASVVAFSHPMSTQNAIGTGIALFGVFLYSQVKRLTSKKDKKAAA